MTSLARKRCIGRAMPAAFVWRSLLWSRVGRFAASVESPVTRYSSAATRLRWGLERAPGGSRSSAWSTRPWASLAIAWMVGLQLRRLLAARVRHHLAQLGALLGRGGLDLRDAVDVGGVRVLELAALAVLDDQRDDHDEDDREGDGQRPAGRGAPAGSPRRPTRRRRGLLRARSGRATSRCGPIRRRRATSRASATVSSAKARAGGVGAVAEAQLVVLRRRPPPDMPRAGHLAGAGAVEVRVRLLAAAGARGAGARPARAPGRPRNAASKSGRSSSYSATAYVGRRSGDGVSAPCRWWRWARGDSNPQAHASTRP